VFLLPSLPNVSTSDEMADLSHDSPLKAKNFSQKESEHLEKELSQSARQNFAELLPVQCEHLDLMKIPTVDVSAQDENQFTVESVSFNQLLPVEVCPHSEILNGLSGGLQSGIETSEASLREAASDDNSAYFERSVTEIP
jgi:hypothetical protein